MPTRWLAIGAVAAVLLAAGIYGARAGWFGGGSGETPPATPIPAQTTSQEKVVARDTAVATVAWGAPAGAPVVGVGSAATPGAPIEATLPVTDGRANVRIRVPRARPDGPVYTSFLVELRAGTTRLWSGNIPASGARDKDDTIVLSLNAAAIGSVDQTKEPLTVVVGAAAPRKGDTLGLIRLTVPKTP